MQKKETKEVSKVEADLEKEAEEESASLSQPQWISTDASESVLTSSPSGEKITLSVNSENLMPGDLVRFTVYHVGDDAIVASETGTVGEGQGGNRARCRHWTVPVQVKGISSIGKELYFKARFSAKKLETKSPVLKITPLHADCVEVHDALFFHNSALMALGTAADADAFGPLNILTEAMIYASEHQDHLTMIYGHADTTGDAAYNMEISKLRAQSVQAMLDGKSEAWVSIAVKKGSRESAEQYLQAFHRAFGWECNPSGGAADGLEPVLKQFQECFNREHEDHLTVDGKLSQETWKAMFHILNEQLGLMIEAKGKNPKAIQMRYASEGGGITACGEKFPIEAEELYGFRSQRNRRVEIAFLDEKRVVPVTRRQIHLDPIVIKALVQPVEKSGLTEMILGCEHSGKRLTKKSLGKWKPFFNPNPPKFPLQVQMQMHPFPEKSH